MIWVSKPKNKTFSILSHMDWNIQVSHMNCCRKTVKFLAHIWLFCGSFDRHVKKEKLGFGISKYNMLYRMFIFYIFCYFDILVWSLYVAVAFNRVFILQISKKIIDRSISNTKTIPIVVHKGETYHMFLLHPSFHWLADVSVMNTNNAFFLSSL